MARPMAAASLAAVALCAARVTRASDAPPIDCQAGFVNWQKEWSDSKKAWCCKHEGKGCTKEKAAVVEAAAAVMVNGEDDAKEDKITYDCDEGLVDWRRGWSAVKKDWCCTHAEKGCEEKPKYDCDAGFIDWEHLWSDQKRSFCCKTASKGCEEHRPPQQATLGISLASFPSAGCRALCTFNGMPAPCKARVRYASLHEFKHQRAACAKSLVRVIEQCEVCATCPLAETGCQDSEDEGSSSSEESTTEPDAKASTSETTPAPTATPAPSSTSEAEAPKAKGCDRTCSVRNISATCKSRISWSATHEFYGKNDACTEAQKRVLDECPKCSECELEKSGCAEAVAAETSTSSTPPFDCLAGYSDWKKQWSAEKRKYCCSKKEDTCHPLEKLAPGGGDNTVVGSRTAPHYDCLAGLDKWKTNWVKEKQEWCFCVQDKIPLSRKNCPSGVPVERTLNTLDAVGSASFDCRTGPSGPSAWSDAKRSWCCKQKDVHCDHFVVKSQIPRLEQGFPGSPRHSWIAWACAVTGLGIVGALAASWRRLTGRSFRRGPRWAVLLQASDGLAE